MVELNASGNDALYQDIATTPGVKVRWQAAHKGRLGVDTAVVEFGAPNGKMVQQSEMKDGKWGWGVYKGEYIIPEDQTTTRFQFRAVSTATGSVGAGNYLDDVQFSTQSILQLTGSFSANSIEVNQDVDYNLHIVNVGGMTAEKNQITIKLPSHLAYTPGTIDTENIVAGTQKYNPSTQELTFEVKALNKDATADIKIPLKGTSITNSVAPSTSATYSDQNFNDDTYLATGNDDSVTITPASWSDWSPTEVYMTGDVVRYDNKYYTAKWWSLGDNPNESEVWQIMNEWMEEWHPLKGYNVGEKVLFEGKIYQAKWWSQGEQPDKSTIWALVQ
ncbi:carbohydrate-binding protein [Listeria riparia]|uniref:carbohydrate-binding protein n=1 Tax=Listeria riparia TaxID=1494964 RepID=UPI0004B8203F|nr:carbohydrate-binding protein [Listeria riparia]